LQGEAPVICLGNDPREYGFVSPAAMYVGKDVIIVAPRETLASITARFGADFEGVDELPPVIILHAGKPALTLPMFLGRGFRGQPLPS
jgi:hypothetical protein